MIPRLDRFYNAIDLFCYLNRSWVNTMYPLLAFP
jgi:hypothetical protein